ncbi:MAG TPA: hypothetical protein VN883_04170 [Myxococcales bacterium]|jgi:hypothetical protein|nr:hypothetical protein [Myxococcales bacterium]
MRMLWHPARPLLLSLALFCACATPQAQQPGWLTGSADHPRYWRAAFVAEAGRSESSAAEAEAQARARVAERIGSRFAHGELIRIVDREQVGGAFYALAALDRAEADAALARDVQQEALSFAAVADRALFAREQQKSGDFAVAAAAADRLRPKLDASFALRSAVLGHAAPDDARFQKRRSALLAAEAEARTRRVIEVRVEGGSRQLRKLAVASVRKLGLRAVEGLRCEDASEWAAQDTTELVFEPDEVCGEGNPGEHCEVAVRVHSRACAGGGEGQGRIRLVRGVHPSDREQARAAAWGRITEALVEAAARDALRGAAYIQCTSPDC